MRARNIKPGFFKNDYLAELGPYAQLLFEGLWLLADRDGKLEDRPARIKAEIFPYYELPKPIELILNDLQNSKGQFILRYTVDDNNYIKILNFEQHQNPHRNETASKIPEPIPTKEGQSTYQGHAKDSASTIQGQSNDGSRPADSLIPDSLIPEKKLKILPRARYIRDPDSEKTDSKNSFVFKKLREIVFEHPDQRYQRQIVFFVEANLTTKNPDAITHCLTSFQNCSKTKKIINPKAWLEKALAVENGNYNEQQSLQDHKQHKADININGIPGLGDVLKSMGPERT